MLLASSGSTGAAPHGREASPDKGVAYVFCFEIVAPLDDSLGDEEEVDEFCVEDAIRDAIDKTLGDEEEVDVFWVEGAIRDASGRQKRQRVHSRLGPSQQFRRRIPILSSGSTDAENGRRFVVNPEPQGRQRPVFGAPPNAQDAGCVCWAEGSYGESLVPRLRGSGAVEA